MAMDMDNINKKYLPDSLIEQILLRLPVRSLLRFKCVCKSWLSLISDPHFAKSHFQFAAAPTSKLVCYYGSDLGSVDPDTLFHDHPAVVNLIPPPPIPSRLEIVGSCRGFIMLHDYPNLILWNPSTGFHKRISYSHIASSADDDGFCTLFYGFGYDTSKDDYLVALAWFDNTGENHLEYFSLRANTWETFEVNLRVSYVDPAAGYWFFVNGTVYWFWVVNGMLAFDLIERKISEIPLPESHSVSIRVKVLGQCLSVCYRSIDDTKVEIWVMKEYNVESSWTVYEIFNSHFDPICLAKDGAIIGFDGHGGLTKYNDNGELLEHRAYCPYRFEEIMYTESLLSLPSDSWEGGEDDQL